MEDNQLIQNSGFEYTPLKGVNIKNAIVTVICTASIVGSVLMSYYGIMGKIDNNNYNQQTAQKITDLRLITLQDQITIINHRLDEMMTENEAKK
jgi:hypothetical protein